MIETAAVLPPELPISSFAALLAPVILVGASATVMAVVGLVVGLVAELRDGMCRRLMARAVDQTRRSPRMIALGARTGS